MAQPLQCLGGVARGCGREAMRCSAGAGGCGELGRRSAGAEVSFALLKSRALEASPVTHPSTLMLRAYY